jgi:ribonuclease-3
LEFLGDAVLGLAVTEQAYERYPAMPEGELAKTRAAVVNAVSLAQVAAALDLGPHLRLGKGEDASGGRAKPSILADAMEAVIGAVYVDGGFEPAGQLVARLFGDLIAVAAEGPGGGDYKTQLQELSTRLFDELPAYQVSGQGPDHHRQFHATVRLAGEVWGEGRGTSKKSAEQEAARAAHVALLADPPMSPGADPADPSAGADGAAAPLGAPAPVLRERADA